MKLFYRSRLWAAIWAYILLIYLTLPLMRSILNMLRESVGREQLGLALNASLVAAAVAILWLGIKTGRHTLLHIVIPLGIILLVASQLHIPEERVHFLQYGLLGLLVLKTSRETHLRQLLVVSLFVVAVGVVDESIQWWLPNRVGDLRDVGMNTLAGLMGIWIGKALFWDPASSPA